MKTKSQIPSKTELEQLYIEDKKSLGEIAEIFGVYKSTVSRWCKKYKIITKVGFYDLTGQTFGRLLVLKRIGTGTNKSPIWECLCECGQVKGISSASLRNHMTKSCGCISKEFAKTWGQKNFRGVGDLSSSYFGSIKSDAVKRNLEFDVTIDYLWDLYNEQQRKCALTGEEIKLSRQRYYRYSTYAEQTASLDRIDSEFGYNNQNIQWLHKVVNNMKQDIDEKEFIDWCRKITRYQDEKRQDSIEYYI